jgi:hypothetical protein
MTRMPAAFANCAAKEPVTEEAFGKNFSDIELLPASNKIYHPKSIAIRLGGGPVDTPVSLLNSRKQN